MEISTRAEALEAGKKTYFTNKPCKNNHITYRYTQSATCSGCVTDSAGRGREAYSRSQEDRAETSAKLTEFPLRCFVVDFQTVKAAAYTLAMMRDPSVQPDDVVSKRPPTGGAAGTLLYKMRAFADDIPAIQKIANDLINSRSVDITTGRMHAFREAARIAEEEAGLPPAFDPARA